MHISSSRRCWCVTTHNSQLYLKSFIGCAFISAWQIFSRIPTPERRQSSASQEMFVNIGMSVRSSARLSMCACVYNKYNNHDDFVIGFVVDFSAFTCLSIVSCAIHSQPICLMVLVTDECVPCSFVRKLIIAGLLLKIYDEIWKTITADQRKFFFCNIFFPLSWLVRFGSSFVLNQRALQVFYSSYFWLWCGRCAHTHSDRTENAWLVR